MILDEELKLARHWTKKLDVWTGKMEIPVRTKHFELSTIGSILIVILGIGFLLRKMISLGTARKRYLPW